MRIIENIGVPYYFRESGLSQSFEDVHNYLYNIAIANYSHYKNYKFIIHCIITEPSELIELFGGRRSEIKEIFYDTIDMDLLNNNWWLKETITKGNESSWSLKYDTSSNKDDVIIYSDECDINIIKSIIKERFGCDFDVLLVSYELNITRFVFDLCKNIVLDILKLDKDNYYISCTIEMDNTDPMVDLYDIMKRCHFECISNDKSIEYVLYKRGDLIENMKWFQ